MDFVASTHCESCHQQEFSRWQGSRHQLAMQVANVYAVLGDFFGIAVPYFGIEGQFTRRNGRFLVTMKDGAGKTEEYQVTHTFGVTPLQQYLVDAPGGRKQALQFAWDSRRPDDGGRNQADGRIQDEVYVCGSFVQSTMYAAGGSARAPLAAATAMLAERDDERELASTNSAPNALVLFNPVLITAPVPGLPHIIIFHGEVDKTVPYHHAELFAEGMRAAGNQCQVVGYPDQGHGFFNFHRKNNSAYYDTVRRMDGFLVALGWLGEGRTERDDE